MINDEEKSKLINQVVENSHASTKVKNQLKDLMCDWPSVCTHKLGRMNFVRHEIKTIDELPLRKRPYRVSKTKKKIFY